MNSFFLTGWSEVARLLIEAGCSTKVRNKDGEIPENCASDQLCSDIKANWAPDEINVTPVDQKSEDFKKNISDTEVAIHVVKKMYTT